MILSASFVKFRLLQFIASYILELLHTYHWIKFFLVLMHVPIVIGAATSTITTLQVRPPLITIFRLKLDGTWPLFVARGVTLNSPITTLKISYISVYSTVLVSCIRSPIATPLANSMCLLFNHTVGQTYRTNFRPRARKFCRSYRDYQELTDKTKQLIKISTYILHYIC